MQITYKAPNGVTSINLSDGSLAVVVDGLISADSSFRNELEVAGFSAVAPSDDSVRYVVDKLTGRIKLPLENGDLVDSLGLVTGQRRASTVWKPIGSTSVTTSTNIGRHSAYVLPFRFYAYRLIALNAHTSAYTRKFGVATAPNTSDNLGNALTWDTPTFSGATSVAIPAATGSTSPDEVYGLVESDLMFRTSEDIGGGKSCVMIRSLDIAANATRYATSLSDFGDLAGRGFYHAFRYGADDIIATPSAFNNPTANAGASPAVAMRFYTEDAVRRIAIFGSSTASGYGDPSNLGWWYRTQQMSSLALSFANHAKSGAVGPTFLRNMIRELATQQYDYAVFWPYTANDTDKGTLAGDQRMAGYIRIFFDECAKYGTTPVLATYQGVTDTNNVSNQPTVNRVSLKKINDEIRRLANLGYCKIIDFATLTNEGTTDNWKDYSDTIDGTHLTAQGHGKMAVIANSVFI